MTISISVRYEKGEKQKKAMSDLKNAAVSSGGSVHAGEVCTALNSRGSILVKLIWKAGEQWAPNQGR